jgi:uncharacterized protein (DUF1501 family)
MRRVPSDDQSTIGAKAPKAVTSEGCEEARLLLSRRAMLGVSAGLFSWAFVPRSAEAAGSDGEARLLVVILRGGMDGLSTVVPHGDKHYVSMRGDLALPEASTIRLNGFFGLHPALKHFGALYRAGDAAVVHATAVPLRSRSHFEAQDNLENGLPGLDPDATGWLNRLLHVLPAGAPVKVGGALEIGEAPLILRGPAPVVGWSPTSFRHVEDPILYMIRTLYRDQDRELFTHLEHGLEGLRMAERVVKVDPDIGVLRNGFRGAGRLLASPTGPRIAVLSMKDR